MKIKAEPYVGPRSFAVDEQDFFFGREKEVDDLVSLVSAYNAILLHAQSGAGKTSLLNASFIPLMQAEGFDVLPVTRVIGGVPEGLNEKDIPNIYAFHALRTWASEASETVASLGTLSDFLLIRPLVFDDEGFPRPRLLIFDQFEEMFTWYPHRWQDREAFFVEVQQALQSDPLLRVLFVMREDWIAHLEPYVKFLPDQLRTRYRLERLRREAALQAVVGPLQALRDKQKQTNDNGAETVPMFTRGTAEKLVDDLLAVRVETGKGQITTAMGEFVEPVQLQITCQRLWESLPTDAKNITVDHLKTVGNVSKALQAFYEDCLQETVEMTGVKEADLRTGIRREFITPASTRGMLYRDEKAGRSGLYLSNSALDVLENRYLIRRERRAGSIWYELSHDRLIEPILESNRIYSKNLEAEKQRNKRWFHIVRSAWVAVILVVLGVLALSLLWLQLDGLGRLASCLNVIFLIVVVAVFLVQIDAV